jgi:hypothetical protein
MEHLDLYTKDGVKLTLPQVLEHISGRVLDKCNRIEVVDEKGRSYVNWKTNNKVQLSMQDGNRTLKIFVDNKD